MDRQGGPLAAPPSRGGLRDVIEVHLLAVGSGPTLDHADAAAFLAAFQPMIGAALKRRLQ